MAINLETSINYEEIILNKQGDSTFISVDDSTLFDRFVNGYKHIVEQAENLDKKIEDIEKKYKDQEGFKADIDRTVEISRANVEFSEDAISLVDGIFGEGTIKKYFRELYEKIPTFLPSADCFIEFFEKITPEMEKLFNRRVEAREAASKERMSKYQPQDHKKPTSRATKAVKK